LSTVLTLALVGGLLSVASPAKAAPPFASSNFNPQDEITLAAADGTNQLVLSDKFDGVDTEAHLSSVSTSDTTQAIYVVCAPGGFVPGPVPPPGCEIIGSDTAGQQVAGFQGDEAYEFSWNIPFQFDNVTRDIGVYHCVGAASTPEPGTNCGLEVESGVFFDDAQNPGGDSSAAEITGYCVDANADGDCDDAGDTSVKPLPHGADVPNLSAYPGGQYLVFARGSADIGTLTLCVDFPADAQNDPDACSFSDSSGAAAAGAFNNYTFQVVTPDNTEMSWWLHNLTGGSGVCDGGAGQSCLLDNHYVVSSAPQAVAAAITFDVPGASCANPDAVETNDLGEDEDVIFCLTDQFGDPFSGPVTLESSGVATAGFEVCDGVAGALHDHDGDGYFEHCHASTGPNGQVSATIGNPSDNSAVGPAVPGTQTVLGCSDAENDPNVPPTDPIPVEHGCADETVTATATKTWVTHPTHVHLVFGGTGDPADPCHSGDQFRENQTGDTDDLLVCTFDAFHNAIGTEAPGDGRLQWFIFPSGGGELTATRFASPPPSETGGDGRATATLEAFRGGNDIIEVNLNTDAGGTIDTDVVQKRVTQTGKPRVESRIGIRGKFRGRVRSPRNACERRRSVVLKKVRPGPDRTVGRDRTNRRGVWRINKPNARGRFYARVQRQEKRRVICLGDRSKIVRRR
jgi:hypothetical protein